MTRRMQYTSWIVIGTPVGWAAVATILDSGVLWASGGWYALLGNFVAAWGTLVTVSIFLIICLILAIFLPLTLLASIQISWARSLINAFERILLPKKSLFETEGYVADDDDHTVWDGIFAESLSHRSSVVEKACSIAQLGALPISAVIILFLLKVF